MENTEPAKRIYSGLWAWAVVAISSVAVAVRAAALGNGRGPVDDAFIAFRYAWNLAHEGGWFFNAPGEGVQAASTPLWVLVLSMFAPAFGPADVRVVPLITLLGAGLQLVAIALLLVTAARSLDRRGTLTIVAALFAVSPTLVDQSFNGMEASLATLILAVVFTARRWGTTWSLSLGLLGLTRPETVVTVMAPLFAVNVIVDWRGRAGSMLVWARSAAIAIAPGVLALVGIAWLRGWANPIPTTLATKNATYGLLCGGPPAWVDRLGSLSALAGMSMASAPIAVGVALALCVLGMILWAVRAGRGSRELWQWTAAWVANVLFQVAIIQYSFPWYSAVSGVTAIFAFALALPVSSSRNGVIAAVGVVTFLGGIDVYKARNFSSANLDVRQLPETVFTQNYIATGLAIRSLLGSKVNVMLEPAGAVGYFSNARIDDTPRLVSTRVTYPPTGGECWFDFAADDLMPDVIVLREQEIRTNRDFVCGFRTTLSCRGQPIPDGYERATKAPENFGPVAPLTILVRKRTHPVPPPATIDLCRRNDT